MPTSVREWPLTSDGVRDKFVASAAARRDATSGQRRPPLRALALSHGSQKVTWLGYDRAFITSHTHARADCVYWPGLIGAAPVRPGGPRTPLINDRPLVSCARRGWSYYAAGGAFRWHRCRCTLVTWTTRVVSRRHRINSWLLWHGNIYIPRQPPDALHIALHSSRAMEVVAFSACVVLVYDFSYAAVTWDFSESSAK